MSGCQRVVARISCRNQKRSVAACCESGSAGASAGASDSSNSGIGMLALTMNLSQAPCTSPET
jgi:hypothetical protein